MQDFGEFDPATKTFKPLPGKEKPGRFGTLPGRIAGIDDMWKTLQPMIAKYDWSGSDGVSARLTREQVAHFPVMTMDEVLVDKQVAHNGILCEQDCPGVGRLQVAKPPANFLSSPSSVRLVAPKPGEHNRAVIDEFTLPEPVVAP